MRVVVIGAGIGGLVLAQALRGAGVEVAVHERDPRPEATGGYRLHLNSIACEILARRLPPPVFQALLASSAGQRTFRQFSVFDHRLRPLLHLPRPVTGANLLIGRVPLRVLLCHGLDDVVRFSREFTHACVDPEGTVTAHFADGSKDHADLLVGADGARSRIATALAGHPVAHRLRASGLAGRTPLTRRTRALLPADLRSGPAFAFGPGGTALFLSAHDPGTTDLDPATCREVPAQVESAYLLWGVTDSGEPPTTGLHDHVHNLFRLWAPRLRALLDAADQDSITAFPYLAADPDAALFPWQAGPVTALGDAVHAMPPTGGRGALTAIRDADELADRIVEVHRGTATVAQAVHGYHRQVRTYAGDAVRESLQPLVWQGRVTPPLAYNLARMVLPVVDAVRNRKASAAAKLFR